MSNRLDKDREERLQPQRVQVAIDALNYRNIVIKSNNETTIVFEWKGHDCLFYPYSGWHSGRSIKDGRGLQHLLEQLK